MGDNLHHTMLPPRARLRDRLPNKSVLAGLAAILLVGGAYLFLAARYPSVASAGGIPECRVMYQHALSARDSGTVDGQIPSTGPQKYPYAQTCGYLRRAGALR
jgi:hypothetical protein